MRARNESPATLARKFVAKTREVGLRGAVTLAAQRLMGGRGGATPLSIADRASLLTNDESGIREQQKRAMRSTSLLHDASQVEQTYPEVLEVDGRILRYGYLPARGTSRGLVVLFHGHNAFLHLGPITAWEDFDILAPWDTFGWNRQGSWFWGEKGVPFVADVVDELIRRHRREGQPLFCMGSSMGGFGALWHGIRSQCDGIYAQAPQVDLRAKVRDYGCEARDNPYGHLMGDDLDSVPSVLDLAEAAEELPPLMLNQHQYDGVNLFAEHGLPLAQAYCRKRAWLGLRVLPAIGHGGDGSQEEAYQFFSLILEKNPPRTVPKVTTGSGNGAP